MGGIRLSPASASGFRLSGFGDAGVESTVGEEPMTDQIPNPASVPPATPSAPASTTPQTSQPGPTIHIADEFGTAERNLPPVKVLLLATAGILIVVGIYSFIQRAKPQGAGSLDNVTRGGDPRPKCRFGRSHFHAAQFG